jgi:exodeoxyribonuclease V alpha subunit
VRLLNSVHGITEQRAAEIVAAYKEHRDARDHMIMLRTWGLTDKQIALCMKTWDQPLGAVVARVQQDPYELAFSVRGFGFLKADKIAKRVGLSNDAPQRVEAGVSYTLDQETVEGHCYCNGRYLQDVASHVHLQVNADLVADAIFRASARQRIRRRGRRIYGAAMDTAEERTANALLKLTDTGGAGWIH